MTPVAFRLEMRRARRCPTGCHKDNLRTALFHKWLGRRLNQWGERRALRNMTSRRWTIRLLPASLATRRLAP